MKRTNGYQLTHIHNIPYLLPYGQNIAEHRRGMKINEAGEFLWLALEEEISHQELLSAFTKKYEALEEEIPELEQDMNSFLSQLSAWGMLEDDTNSRHSSHDTYLHIAGISICISGPKEAISDNFTPFIQSECHDTPSLTIEILTTSGPTVTSTGGALLICTEELIVSQHAEEYTILFPQAKQIQEARIHKDGSRAQIRCHLPYRDILQEDIFHAIRMLFLYRAQTLGFRAIHSASLWYKEKAWLFSGSSGTGKSTHTNLWKDAFDTPILNGDVNLISCFDGIPSIHGTPWCGTSGMADPGTYPLGGIIFLKQFATNECVTLSPDEQALRIVQRMISPCWTAHMLDDNLIFAQNVAENILVTRLLCTKEPAAAHYMKSIIDDHIRRDL
nr:PqqD family protein [Eubacterium sp.]